MTAARHDFAHSVQPAAPIGEWPVAPRFLTLPAAAAAPEVSSLQVAPVVAPADDVQAHVAAETQALAAPPEATAPPETTAPPEATAPPETIADPEPRVAPEPELPASRDLTPSPSTGRTIDEAPAPVGQATELTPFPAVAEELAESPSPGAEIADGAPEPPAAPTLPEALADAAPLAPPTIPAAPEAPEAPVAPATPVMPEAAAPVMPEAAAPVMPEAAAPVMPEAAPAAPEAPAAPIVPEAPLAAPAPVSELPQPIELPRVGADWSAQVAPWPLDVVADLLPEDAGDGGRRLPAPSRNLIAVALLAGAAGFVALTGLMGGDDAPVAAAPPAKPAAADWGSNVPRTLPAGDVDAVTLDQREVRPARTKHQLELAMLAMQPGEVIRELTIRNDGTMMLAVVHGAKQRNIVTKGQAPPAPATPVSPDGTPAPILAIDPIEIDARIPRKLLRAVERAKGVPPSTIKMVRSASERGGKATWVMQWADAAGRPTTAIYATPDGHQLATSMAALD